MCVKDHAGAVCVCKGPCRGRVCVLRTIQGAWLGPRVMMLMGLLLLLLFLSGKVVDGLLVMRKIEVGCCISFHILFFCLCISLISVSSVCVMASIMLGSAASL